MNTHVESSNPRCGINLYFTETQDHRVKIRVRENVPYVTADHHTREADKSESFIDYAIELVKCAKLQSSKSIKL